MPYTILLSLDTVGASILNVDLYNCTGDTLGNVSGCTGNTLTNYTVMSGYSNILKRDFPKYVTVPDGTYYIKAVASNINDGGCNLNEITPIRIQMPTTPTPTPTPSPTPTNTPTAVPTATPTNTPIPCSFDANVVYGLPGTTPPTLPPTNVPTNVPTATPTSFNVKYGLVSNGASAACNAGNSLNITTNNGDFCSATYVYGVASLPSGLYFLVYNNNTINVNVTSLNNTGVVTSAGCELCPGNPTTPPTLPPTTPPTLPPTTPPTLPPTNVPTNVPTPTPTFIPYQLTVFTGNSLSTACSNLVNPLLEPTILFYQGSLGIGTILYRNNNYTNAVTPTVYCAADSSTVYVVGTPSDTDGQITEITSCPAATLEPTPIPEPATYDVYEKCSLDGTLYYINHNENNSTILSINNFCCSRVMSDLSPETIATNYSSAIYFSNYVNAVCDCN